MKLFNIKEGHIQTLSEKKIPLSFIWVLEQLKAGGEIPEGMLKDKQWGERKGYLDGKGNITTFGEELYNSLFGDSDIKIKKRISVDDKFTEWFGTAYPHTNSFTHKGVKFDGTQKKTIQKDDCMRLFNVISNGGQYSADDIIRATEYIVLKKKEDSVKKRDNQLTYLPNSYRFLKERLFEPFVEISKQKKEDEEFSI